MSEQRDLRKPISLQPIGGQPSPQTDKEASPAPPLTVPPMEASSARPPLPLSSPTPPDTAPAATAYLRTAAPVPVDNTPINPGDNLRRLAQIEQEQDNSPRIRAMLFGGGALTIVLALNGFVFSKMPHPAVAASEYSLFTAANHSFACDVPKGWNQRATGEAADESSVSVRDGIFIESGSAHIEVSMSTVAGLATGQLLFGGSAVPGAMSGQGNAETVAGLQKKPVARRFVGYTEKRQKDVNSKMSGTEGLKELEALAKQSEAARQAEGGGTSGPVPGIKLDIEPDVRLFEFTATEPWYNLGGKVHGYRAVFAGGAYVASILCYCPEAEWRKVKPVFQHVMESVREVPRTESEQIKEETPQEPTGAFTPPPG